VSWARATDDVWAVGGGEPFLYGGAVIVHWDGLTWSVQDTRVAAGMTSVVGG